jgi:hypothetical protein
VRLIVGDIERSQAPASLNQPDAPVTVPADHVSVPVIVCSKLWIVQRTRTEQGLLTVRARRRVHADPCRWIFGATIIDRAPRLDPVGFADRWRA